MRDPLFNVTKAEFFPGTNVARKLICKLCGDPVYEISKNSKQPEILIEVNRLKFHLELQHNTRLLFVDTDSKCGKIIAP